MSVRENQKSGYVSDDVRRLLEEFYKRYPRVTFTDISNAALREYLKLAKDGVDGNLKPLNTLKK